MADRSMKRLLGIIDDVLVRVDKFILLVNFVILDSEEDYRVPIILGRSFLATGKALVDVEAGELTFWAGDEKVVFHVCKSMKQPNSTERRMMAIFTDMVEDILEVFMDDFSVVGDSFDECLKNLDRFLACCEENLVPNWEKCHFMVDEGIVVGHKISKHGIEFFLVKGQDGVPS
ncbi:uncharacterized protein [Nicotiana sylvestris]|uniref:uncharacterized protein n=1 Tax=Nicotiana sylvestris TaxID=4096 RepID=UPI00388CA120